MDNVKTGAFIKELRKEKCLTQKELADFLYITDKAVSKWERGLCAPDISLFEPLAQVLDISIVELIGGERVMENENIEKIEINAKNVIDYSKNEIEHKTRAARNKYLIATAIGIVLVASIILISLWWTGYFNIIDKSVSPDGNMTITVYDRDVFSVWSRKPAVSVLTKLQGRGEYRKTYGNAIYQGILWSPDSKKYVASFGGYAPDEKTFHALTWLEYNSESNLNALIPAGVPMIEQSEYSVEYQILQWSADSSSILVYYSFLDANNNIHSGYYWYNCENGEVSAPFEIDLSQ